MVCLDLSIIFNVMSTSDGPTALVDFCIKVGKWVRGRKKKKKRHVVDQFETIGNWNKKHSPLSSKRSFFVSNPYSARSVTRSYVNYGGQ